MNKQKDQSTLFDNMSQFNPQAKEWKGMPEFSQEDLQSWKSIIVHFENRQDMEAFSKLINQKLTYNTRSVWYPQAEIGHYSNKRYIDES